MEGKIFLTIILTLFFSRKSIMADEFRGKYRTRESNLTLCTVLKACGHDPKVPLKVAFVSSNPVNFYFDENGKKVMHGKTIGFFKYLNNAYGWKTEHVEEPNKRWGTPYPNGSFNGMIGMVVREEVDMAAGMITINHMRAQVVEFSFPYNFDTVSLLSHKPSLAPKWMVLAWPFGMYAWTAIISSFLIFSLGFYAIFLLANDKSYSFTTCAMECFKQYLGASTHQWPEKYITKMIFCLWVVMAFILKTAYSGGLLSALTKSPTLPEINSLKDLFKSSYHELIFDFSNTKTVFEESNFTDIKHAYTKFKGRKINPFGGGIEETFMKQPESVFPVDKEPVNLSIGQSWGLPPGKTFTHWSGDYIQAIAHGIALQKGSKLRECINDKILRSQEAGLWYKWRSDAIFIYRMNHPVNQTIKAKMRAYLNTLPQTYDENEPLNIDQLQTSYYVYFVMIFITCMAFILEKANHGCLKKQGEVMRSGQEETS